MKTTNTLLILDLITENGEVVSTMAYLPADTEVLSCIVCRNTISNIKAGKEGKNIRVSHRPIEWQLSQQYVWISVPKETHIEVFCPRCAEVELMVPRI